MTKSAWLRTLGSLAMGLAIFSAAAAQAQLRVAAWNISNYSGGRTADIQAAVYGVYQDRALLPDAILCQEFLSASAVTAFVSALNTAPNSPGDWAGATFVDGPDTDSAFVYRTSKLTLLGVTVVATGGVSPNHPRNIMRYDVRLQGYAGPGATLACYSTHMKAGTTSEDQARRLLEAQRIRDDAEALDPAWSFVVGGDFNIQSSTQAAYQELVGLQANNAGRFFDPIATPGSWNNNAAFRFVHTQDPIGAGGMDDRHDQLLLGGDLVDGDGFDYLGDATVPYSTTTWDDPNHSYRAWGNDGTTFNTTLAVASNQMVGPAIAQALINIAASAGHLPVFLDLRVPAQVGADSIVDFGQVPQGAVAEQPLAVWNAGDVALWTAAGIADLCYSLSASSGFAAPAGQFCALADAVGNVHTLTMDTTTVGAKLGTVTVASNAADEPVRVVTLVGEVVADGSLSGDLNCDGEVSFRDINPFIMALTDPPGWQVAYPGCPPANGDANGDGSVDFRDINPFILLLAGS
ncbi:MAG TPA: hypothetical protein PLP66_09545 [Phycisphaerae bacterium]|nr:hypothetical protein [Phycisphaerae bacterium]